MIWLIGNRGMLGTELSEALARSSLPFVGTDREVSILDQEALASFTRGKDINWIVNCAAYTAVDKAEDEAGLCRALNTDGPANIARLATSIGASLLHISTDYVFDGKGSRPYQEDDKTCPTGVYGKTKADGEAAALAACPRTVILRTAWLYGRHGPNFVTTMLRLMKEKDSIGVVADQKGSPTWARDLSHAITAILSAEENVYGIFHFTDGGEITWHDFAVEIQRLGRNYGLLENDCTVNALTTAQYPTKTHRPPYSVLSKEKIVKKYGVEVPDWKESLERFLKG
ncbi:MAG TPA: dTDP-4-dehydrorhamnose reductase [Treponema sp.]|nr:MAG: dTDP-4-dehydrorhamnose reductase [Treponema sp. GWC1_61_84]OHE73317.1 MAG: dTDP-4-dehydrorhamnose reductase [Treponema sp. RIFOXYC1_FULL_61_9]HCM26019.1 dTDP-4-dehydrorhamnose reductase [Treponema sp.]